jgi:hypothetical protein
MNKSSPGILIMGSGNVPAIPRCVAASILRDQTHQIWLSGVFTVDGISVWLGVNIFKGTQNLQVSQKPVVWTDIFSWQFLVVILYATDFLHIHLLLLFSLNCQLLPPVVYEICIQPSWWVWHLRLLWLILHDYNCFHICSFDTTLAHL